MHVPSDAHGHMIICNSYLLLYFGLASPKLNQMKFSSLISLLALSLTISQQLSAQNDRYIEIGETDTVRLKPLQFTYQIRTDNDPMYFGRPRKGDSTRSIVPLAYLEDLLTKNKFVFTVEDKSYYTIIPDRKTDSVITLNLNSESELRRLYGLLTKVQGISGKIIDAKFESPASYQNEMYGHLYAKALRDANDLAKISGNSIGRLISVHEPQLDFLSGIMDSYKRSVGTTGLFAGMLGNGPGMSQQTEKALVFKFELK